MLIKSFFADIHLSMDTIGHLQRKWNPKGLETIWCKNIIIWDYESVWPKVWPQNKYRSLWPIFYGPVILPYVLTIWCMYIILWEYESVRPEVWPKN